MRATRGGSLFPRLGRSNRAQESTITNPGSIVARRGERALPLRRALLLQRVSRLRCLIRSPLFLRAQGNLPMARNGGAKTASPAKRKGSPASITYIPDGQKLKKIKVPGQKNPEVFLVDKGPLEGLPGTKIQEALMSMPNGGKVGAKPVSKGFRRAAGAAKAFGVPPKGWTVDEWVKPMSLERRKALRDKEMERRKAARAAMSPEEKKAKQNRRRSAKAAAGKVKRISPDKMKSVVKKIKSTD